eukprot:scaffold867_cov317-Pavlova_lutheri.AAC.68
MVDDKTRWRWAWTRNNPSLHAKKRWDRAYAQQHTRHNPIGFDAPTARAPRWTKQSQGQALLPNLHTNRDTRRLPPDMRIDRSIRKFPDIGVGCENHPKRAKAPLRGSATFSRQQKDRAVHPNGYDPKRLGWCDAIPLS